MVAEFSDRRDPAMTTRSRRNKDFSEPPTPVLNFEVPPSTKDPESPRRAKRRRIPSLPEEDKPVLYLSNIRHRLREKYGKAGVTGYTRMLERSAKGELANSWMTLLSIAFQPLWAIFVLYLVASALARSFNLPVQNPYAVSNGYPMGFEKRWVEWLVSIPMTGQSQPFAVSSNPLGPDPSRRASRAAGLSTFTEAEDQMQSATTVTPKTGLKECLAKKLVKQSIRDDVVLSDWAVGYHDGVWVLPKIRIVGGSPAADLANLILDRTSNFEHPWAFWVFALLAVWCTGRGAFWTASQIVAAGSRLTGNNILKPLEEGIERLDKASFQSPDEGSPKRKNNPVLEEEEARGMGKASLEAPEDGAPERRNSPIPEEQETQQRQSAPLKNTSKSKKSSEKRNSAVVSFDSQTGADLAVKPLRVQEAGTPGRSLVPDSEIDISPRSPVLGTYKERY